jgi:adenylate kinase family enzyme
MQRVVIVGRSGSGKSTLARELGTRLALPVVHLDSMYWQPGWQPPADRAAFDARVLEVVARDKWIIEGGYSSTLPQRLERADMVVLTMMPLWMCLWRVLRRVAVYRGKTRPDMGAGCPEKVDLEFMSYILAYRRQTLPRVEAMFAEHFAGVPVRLSTPREVEAFLASVPGGD